MDIIEESIQIGVSVMFTEPGAEYELKREQACSDDLCRKNVRKEYFRGDEREDNQENRESLLCKINLC